MLMRLKELKQKVFHYRKEKTNKLFISSYIVESKEQLSPIYMTNKL